LFLKYRARLVPPCVAYEGEVFTIYASAAPPRGCALVEASSEQLGDEENDIAGVDNDVIRKDTSTPEMSHLPQPQQQKQKLL